MKKYVRSHLNIWFIYIYKITIKFLFYLCPFHRL